ncbi:hypothetical protein Cadr_000019471 [Camelus dromedarius]|uniref:Uncharacterized protein n=1 Tax=Camelus dromedarius TaxID=9838 RepID=A0A5N4D333_CAMDR|nr:hypothetical protein Cadr_000019471 [Camelus dromedarius]
MCCVCDGNRDSSVCTIPAWKWEACGSWRVLECPRHYPRALVKKSGCERGAEPWVQAVQPVRGYCSRPHILFSEGVSHLAFRCELGLLRQEISPLPSALGGAFSVFRHPPSPLIWLAS